MEDLVNLAKEFSKCHHSGQFYGDGRDYFIAHIEPVVKKAVELATKLGLNVSKTAILAYMHDVLEDCDDVSPDMVENMFGKDVLNSLMALSNRIASLKTPMMPVDEYLRIIGQANSETKIVKVADRIINVSALPEHKDNNKREILTKKYADQLVYFEKYDIYPELVRDS